jgi:hypothetical protein
MKPEVADMVSALNSPTSWAIVMVAAGRLRRAAEVSSDFAAKFAAEKPQPPDRKCLLPFDVFGAKGAV